MKAIVEDINSVQRRVKVTVPTEAVNKAFTAYYQRVRGKAKIHGFRPGKAPLTLIKKMYGGSGTYDIVDQLIREHLMDSIQETGLKMISKPYIENSELPIENQPFEIIAVVDILPEISLESHHKGLNVTFETHDPSEKDFEARLQQLAQQQARLQGVEEGTACAEGHLVRISYQASIDGVAEEELTAQDQVLEVGKKYSQFPEMESALVGMKNGETKTVSIVFDKETAPEKFHGKTAVFEVTLNSLQKVEVPEINEDFAKDLSFDSLEDLKTKVRDGVISYFERANEDARNNALLKALSEKVSFEVPPSITDQVIDHMISQSEFPSEQEKKNALADKELRERLLGEAKSRAKNTMLLHEVLKAENIEISDSEIREEISQMSQEADAEKKAEEVEKIYTLHADNIREQLLFKKALSFLASEAKLHAIPASLPKT